MKIKKRINTIFKQFKYGVRNSLKHPEKYIFNGINFWLKEKLMVEKLKIIKSNISFINDEFQR